MSEVLYPKFSPQELARRHEAIRQLMVDDGLDAVVVYGSSGVNRHDQADVHYVSNFLGNRNNYAVVTHHEPPVIFVQSFNHVPNARESSGIRVEWGGTSSAATVGKYLLDVGLKNAKLGYVGDVPVQTYLAWQRDLPGFQMVDVTRTFRRLRLIKSAEEIDWIRKGAMFTDKAFNALVEGVRQGLHEYELGMLIETAALSAGGLPHLHYLSSGPQSGGGACVPRQNLSSRLIERGDVINTEISVSHWGYSGQMHRPIFIGQQPNDLYRRLWDTALESYERCVKVLRPGATSEDVLDAGDIIAERGFTINDGFLHGFGIGLLPPSIGTRESADRRGPAGPLFTFKENMCVVVQPNVVTDDERAGVQLGNLFLITADGAECLHGVPLQYFVVGA
jgi:Xaa-Pro aminopeptidase